MDKNKTFYETSSLLLATTLVSLGIPLDSLSKSYDGKYIFTFLHDVELDHLLEAFWSKSLKIEPNIFWENRRFLKSRMSGG